MNNHVNIDTRIASKEALKKNIRKTENHNSQSKISVASISGPLSSLMPDDQNYLTQFVTRFREAGGKYMPCTRNNFLDFLIQYRDQHHAGILLNTSNHLKKLMERKNIPYTLQKSFYQTPDIAVAYAPAIIASNGGLMFSSALNTYPSVKNLTPTLIVISFLQFVVSTLSDAFNLLNKNSSISTNPCNNTEIIVPTPLTGPPTCKNPQIILFLIFPE